MATENKRLDRCTKQQLEKTLVLENAKMSLKQAMNATCKFKFAQHIPHSNKKEKEILPRKNSTKNKENDNKDRNTSKALQAAVGNLCTLLEQNKVNIQKNEDTTSNLKKTQLKPRNASNMKSGVTNRAISTLKSGSSKKRIQQIKFKEPRSQLRKYAFNNGQEVDDSHARCDSGINFIKAAVKNTQKNIIIPKENEYIPQTVPNSTKGNQRIPSNKFFDMANITKRVILNEPVKAKLENKSKKSADQEIRPIIPLKSEGLNITGNFVQSLENLLIGKQIGHGAYATVRIAFDKDLNKKVALKIYDKSKLGEPQRQLSVQREINLMGKLSHPNIVKLHDTFDTKRHVVLEMEYIQGMSLHGYLKSKSNRRLEEVEAKRLFLQILSGIEYCHSKSITHRDIKLENLLLDEHNNVKIIDFGFSTCIPNTKKIRIFCGTPSYMSPEIVSRKEYAGPPADVWALGVLLYAMLCGTFPFKGSNDKELYRRINSGQFVLPEYLSAQSKALLIKILRVDADDRPTAQAISEDEWFKKKKIDNPILFQDEYNSDLQIKKPEITSILNNVAPGSTVNNNFNIINNITHINYPGKSNTSSLLCNSNHPSARDSIDYDLVGSIVKLGYSINEVQKEIKNEKSHIHRLYKKLLGDKKNLNMGIAPQLEPSFTPCENLGILKARKCSGWKKPNEGNITRVVKGYGFDDTSEDGPINELNNTAPLHFGGNSSGIKKPKFQGLFRVKLN